MIRALRCTPYSQVRIQWRLPGEAVHVAGVAGSVATTTVVAGPWCGLPTSSSAMTSLGCRILRALTHLLSTALCVRGFIGMCSFQTLFLVGDTRDDSLLNPRASPRSSGYAGARGSGWRDIVCHDKENGCHCSDARWFLSQGEMSKVVGLRFKHSSSGNTVAKNTLEDEAAPSDQ